MEFSPIKRLMLRPYGREEVVGVKVSGGHHAKPDCGIWQCSMESRKVLVCDKAGRIDEDFAGVELRLQKIGKDFE